MSPAGSRVNIIQMLLMNSIPSPCLRWLLYGLCLFSLTTCRKQREIDPLADGLLRIRSIQFPGIPDKDVSIDQMNYTIRVKLPPMMSGTDFKPTIQLTDSLRIKRIDYNNVFLRFSSLCRYPTNEPLQIFLHWINKQGEERLTTYKVQLVSSGPLAISNTIAPYTIVLGLANNIHIPFQNLYANPVLQSIRLTDRTTGESYLIEGGTYTYLACSEQTNHFKVSIGSLKIVPGTYNIEVQTADGQLLRANQPLLVQKGPAELTYDPVIYFGYRTTVGGSFTTEGYNLFAEDIQLQLIDQQNQSIPLTEVSFEKTGSSMRVQLPNSLKPGAYVMKLFQNGQQRPNCYRVQVKADSTNNLIFGILGKDTNPCSISEPAKIARNVSVLVTHSEFDKPNTRLKLASLATPPVVYYTPIKPYELYMGNAPTLIIPLTVPAGIYEATIQVFDLSTGVVLRESEPYGRRIQLQ